MVPCQDRFLHPILVHSIIEKKEIWVAKWGTQKKLHKPISKCLQIQFTSNRLSFDMFKVSNGVVEGLKMDTRGLESLNNNWNRKNNAGQKRELSPYGYM